MKHINGRWHLAFATILVGALVAACGAARLGSEGITMHTWRTLTAQPTSTWTGARSGLYTYVLVGDIGTGSSNQATKNARESLKNLLAQVMDNIHVPPTSTTLPAPDASRVNQFCVPVIPAAEGKESIAIDDYDVALSSTYVHWFQVILDNDPALRQKIRGTGPFFIATRQPVQEIVKRSGATLEVNRDSPILFVDMSGSAPGAAPYYMKAFREAVIAQPPVTAELKPLQPVLATALDLANRGVPFVAEVWSKTLKAFTTPT